MAPALKVFTVLFFLLFGIGPVGAQGTGGGEEESEELSSASVESTERVAELDAEIANINEELQSGEMTNRQSEIQEELVSLREELTSLRAEEAALETTLAAERSRDELAVQQEQAAFQAQMAEIRDRMNTQLTQIRELEDQLETRARLNPTYFLNPLESREERLNAFSQQILEEEMELDALRSRYYELLNEQAALTQFLYNEQTQDIEEIRQAKENFELERTRIQSEIKDLTREQSRVQQQLTAMRQQVEELNNERSALISALGESAAAE